MELIDLTVAGVHLLFGGLWTGSILFVTVAVLPTARDGTIDSEPLARVTSRFTTIARSSALVTLATGAYWASAYDVGKLVETTEGKLVVAMVLLWIGLGALSEIGAARLADGTDKRKVRTPATEARPFFLVGSLLAVALLLDAGALAIL